MAVSFLRLIALSLCVIGICVCAQAAQGSPFACDLTTLTHAERVHKGEISTTLAGRRLGVRELPDGYEFSFPGDRSTFQLVADWVDTERLCCPFFDFDLRADRERGRIALRLTGRPGTKAFIKADFEKWLQ